MSDFTPTAFDPVTLEEVTFTDLVCEGEIVEVNGSPETGPPRLMSVCRDADSWTLEPAA